MRVHTESTLPAPPERVWSLLTDWERQAVWMPDVAWIRVRGAERSLGAEIDVRTKVLGVPLATDLMTVKAWEPPRRLQIEHRGVVAGVGEWILEPAPNGRTRFMWTEDIRMPPPVLGGVALWLYGPVQRWMVRRSLANLARLLDEADGS